MKRFLFGICEWAVNERGLSLCKLVKEVGLDAIQLSICNEALNNKGLLNKKVVEEYIKGKEIFGIDFTSIALPFLDQISMCISKESDEYRKALEIIFEAIDIAHTMGIRMVMLPSFNRSAINDDSAFDLTVNNFIEICRYASGMGIMVTTENNMSATNMIRLINKVGYDNFKIYFDTQNHYLKDGTYIPDLIEELFPYIYEIHVKDGKEKELSGALLGTGDSNFLKTAEKILHSEYSGYIVLENYYNIPPLSNLGDEKTLLMKDVETLKSVFAE